MASELVQRFRNDVAPRLLARFGNGGVSVVITVTTANIDPLLPPIETSSTNSVNAVASGVSANILTIDPNISATDVQLIVAAIDYVPVIGGRIELNGKDRAIVRVDAIPAAGDPAVYKFLVR